MNPVPFEVEFPEAGETLKTLYATQKSRFFEAGWLHFFSNGGWNNIPFGRYS